MGLLEENAGELMKESVGDEIRAAHSRMCYSCVIKLSCLTTQS